MGGEANADLKYINVRRTLLFLRESIDEGMQFVVFEPNKAMLNPDYDANIPKVLEEIGKLAGSFGNAYIVIEGNTDASRKGIVPADLVRQLSYDRADAVRKRIIEKYKFDPNKFKVVGNGWDNPVPGMTDPSNPEHNKRNRRVEVKVFPLEKE